MIEIDSSKTRHEVIAGELEKQLFQLASGSKLPTVRHLMNHYQVSQATIDRSLHCLEEKGLIERIAGRGYFRTPPFSSKEETLKIDFCFFVKKHVVNNPLYSRIRDAMLMKMHQRDCFMNILVYEDMGCVSEFRSRIRRNAPDAFIMMACSKVSFHYVLRDMGIPDIQVYPNFMEKDVLTYRIDNERAIRLAIEHLYSLGHRRIALLHGQGAENTYMLDQEERIETFYSVMAEKKLPATGPYVKFGGFSTEGGFSAANELLSLPERKRPTAIIANDYSAPGVYRAAEAHSLSVPKDLSVVGFDKLNSTEFLQPSLTTIDICWEPMTDLLVEKAIELARKRQPESGLIRTNVALVKGKSTAAAPGSPKTRN
ncbi:MAG: putative HTH-type transcriptional repressor ExuR [Lentisphaerae bacterium ADurb.Bin242]|nr:MAG: putative HTH-type transcriptional repressor ExuR [Lentisphaerae bacterium ADurb.Bin242]